jgi:hypothetical protein
LRRLLQVDALLPQHTRRPVGDLPAEVEQVPQHPDDLGAEQVQAAGAFEKILGPLPFNKEILPLNLHTTKVVAGWLISRGRSW